MSDALINRVAESGLITLRPEEWLPGEQPVAFDLKPFLFKELILREQDFRSEMKTHDWSAYQDKVVCLFCSADAIIPNWAYMLVVAGLSGIARHIFFGSPEQYMAQALLDHIDRMDIEPYQDQRVILKGCSDGVSIGPEVYVALSARLMPVVKSLMFGEPCSTVPVYKRPKAIS